jgi:hypothetical protein
MVQDLVLRRSLIEGRTSTVSLSDKLAIGPVLMTRVVEEMRDRKLFEVIGIDGRDYQLVLTEEGRRQATERMQLCRYVGPAPVNLAQYTAMVAHQHAEPRYDLETLRESFADLVISDKLLAQIGPAAMGRGAMFLYGPPGTGKSSIAERLHRVQTDSVFVPYAVEVDSQIITLFDPVVHRPRDEQPEGTDPRWVLCERPFITVGGELTAEQLDLKYQAGSGTYSAPLQMQANSGILIIDDFGRQALSPEALLNRWIVPLDRHLDYLSLEYGMKFPVPFDAKIVFSTNLAPESLGDEAFFRRIQSKVLIPPIRDRQFEAVLERVARDRAIEMSADAPTHLRWMSRTLGDGDLRPYLPSAVINILESICAFEQRPLYLDPPMIERIADMYFTQAAEQSLVREMAAGGELDMPAPATASTRAEPTASGEPPPAIASKKVRSIFAAPAEEADTAAAPGRADWAAAAAKALAAETGQGPDAPSGDDADLPGRKAGGAKKGGRSKKAARSADDAEAEADSEEPGEADGGTSAGGSVPTFDYDRVVIT